MCFCFVELQKKGCVYESVSVNVYIYTVTTVYSSQSTQVTLTTLTNGKGVIQVSGHARLLQDVKTAVKNLVGRIIHKTDKFSIPGRQSCM